MKYQENIVLANPISLGCVTFGREIDKNTSFALMDRAWSMGVNLFDTASAYGNGASEEIVGAWFKQNPSAREAVVIATKILPPYDPASIRLSVEQCLKRLRVETIDILYLHRWDEKLASRAVWEALFHLIMEGKIKTIGVSNFNTQQLTGAINVSEETGSNLISYIQNNHNLAVSDVNGDMRNICKKTAIKIITYSPLGAGFLTGKYLQGVEANSRFGIIPGHQAIYFNEHAQKRLQKLLKVASDTGYSAGFLAMAWALHPQDIYSVLVGGRSVAQLDLAFEAAKFNSPQIFAELESV